METPTMSRAEKILVFLYEYGKGESVKVRYEDIVVGVFKKFPHDFHLKGYTEYPDSGDIIHKPLYDFKKKGYINAANKIFALTDHGIEAARHLADKKGGTSTGSEDRLPRDVETETSRVKSLEGFGLFAAGSKNKLSDSDLYAYLGVTVRTPKPVFIGRLETMNDVARKLTARKDDPLSMKIAAYHDYLIEKHRSVIDYFVKSN